MASMPVMRQDNGCGHGGELLNRYVRTRSVVLLHMFVSVVKVAVVALLAAELKHSLARLLMLLWLTTSVQSSGKNNLV